MLLLTQSINAQSSTPVTERGELFSILLRLHTLEPGQVSPGSGNQVQAAFLDMVRQGDPALAEWLHQPNQRRPYTLSLLQGFNHLTTTELADATNRQQTIEVRPGQVYWLRITMLDSTIFNSFAQHLIANPRSLKLRLGHALFEISRLIAMPEQDNSAQSWVAYSSFAELHTLQTAQKLYRFEFASPTAFSQGQKSWGKPLKLFPAPEDVFGSLARQWELFAPTKLRLSAHELIPQHIAAWCVDNVIVTNYNLATRHLPSSKFGQTGCLGDITYEVKGNPSTQEARWLTPLARFALFSGVGYKTAMGMGQARCTNLIEPSSSTLKEDAQ
jgi:CRISPR-associated endoribonuclease Cas6